MKRDKNFQYKVDNLINVGNSSELFLETAHARIRENAAAKNGTEIAESPRTVSKPRNVTQKRGRLASVLIFIAAAIGAFIQWVYRKISGKKN